jgi:hypothetical protein
MKSIPDVPVETRGSSGASTTGGGGSSKVWTITGRVLVRESEIDGNSHDRPLKGIEVKVSASDLGADGPWTEWGTVRTDADGDFSVSESNNGRTRFFRVQARLVGVGLAIEDGTGGDIASLDLLDRNWRTIWKSESQREGPAVAVGTRVFASGQPLDLGSATFRRQALIWYVLRAAIDRLEDEDAWFSMNGEVKAVYPANTLTDTTYNGVNNRILLHQGQPDDDWHPGVVLEQFMLMWHDVHTEGSRKISGYPSAAFAHGFALFASNALMHELWGVRLRKPLNRRTVAAELELSTLDEIEGSEPGVENALRLLRCGERTGWWSHLFGTAQSYPDNRPDDDGDGKADQVDEVGVKHRLDGREVPAGQHSLSLWDILRTYRANPSKGWATDLNVEDPESSVMVFIGRAVDIHELGQDVHVMLLRSLDPLASDEPFASLPKR